MTTRSRIFRPTFVARLLMIAASTCTGVIVAEGVARLFVPHLAPRTAAITQFWRYDSRYGWSHNPGASGSFETYGVRSFVTINSRGFRGPLIEYARHLPTPRVLVLGDSYVWGYGINDEDVLTERLRQAIPGVEIVNMGVSGYSTDQEFLLYCDESFRYNADVVMIVVTENDFTGNLLTRQYVAYGKPAFRFENDQAVLVNHPVPKAPLWTTLAARFAMRSYLLTAMNRYLYSKDVTRSAASAAREQRRLTGTDAQQAGTGGFPQTPEAEITARLLLELNREILARQTRGSLLVVLTEEVTHSRDMAAYLSSHDIATVDLGEYIDAEDQSLHLPGDFHWNASGHRRAADALSKTLERLLNQK